MGYIFRNKFFIIFLIIACVLTAVTMGLNLAGYGNLVSDTANKIIEPFQALANIIKNSVSGFIDYFTKFNEYRDENAELKAYLRELEAEIEEAREIKAQNDMLRRFFDLKDERPDFIMLEASVIAGSAGNYITGMTINRGAFHGIGKDMPVISADGVVGYISHVDFRSARISPFIRAGNKIGVYIVSEGEKTGDTGIVEGVFELAREGLCRLVNLTREADISEGDKIYSSGYSEMYPEGLFIGTVVSVYNDANTHTPAALIEPGVNFNKLRDVMIVLEFNWIFE